MAKPDPNKASDDADAELAEALAKLSPEEAEIFLQALELTLKRRRLLLVGYIAAVFALIGGMAGALYIYGTREPGTFVGWVFLVPFAAMGLILMVFGRLAKSSRGATKRSERNSESQK